MGRKIAIVGAGMAGAVMAMYLARRGFQVTVFERNADPRAAAPASGRSINLTLTRRGLDALRELGLLDAVLAAAVPVSQRLVHLPDGREVLAEYGENGSALHSINRMVLNRILLAGLAERYGIEPLFHHKCVDLGLEDGRLTFETPMGTTLTAQFDTLFGADGAFSGIRALLAQKLGFQVTQSFSSHANLELNIAQASGWTGRADVLHVWPRQEYMLIAFPNPDGSFTLTLQVPTTGRFAIEELKAQGNIEELFERHFAAIRPFITDLTKHVKERPAIQMAAVKSDTWFFADRLCLLGDAAHAVFPSLGQGANCAFEDCQLLNNLLEAASADWSAAFAAFQSARKPATDALCELSNEHFERLRQSVGSSNEGRRAQLRNQLRQICPQIGHSLYSNIAFTHIPYHVLRRNERIIEELITELDQPGQAHYLNDSQALRRRLREVRYA